MPPKHPGAAFLVAQVGAHAARRFGERLAALSLQPQHAGALRILGFEQGLTQRELAQRLGMFPSRAVTLVDELEQRKLISRGEDPDDRRSYSLRLTDKGWRALGEVGKVAREHQDSLLAALADNEREQLAKLLLRIADEQGLTPGVHPGFRTL